MYANNDNEVKTVEALLARVAESHNRSDFSTHLPDLEAIISTLPQNSTTASKAHLLLAVGYQNQSKPELTDRHLKLCENGPLFPVDKDFQSRTYNVRALWHYNQGDYVNSISTHLKALEIREQGEDKVAIAQSCFNLGRNFERLGENTRALTYYQRATDISVELGLQHKESLYRTGLAGVYQAMMRDEECMRENQRALKIAEEVNNERLISVALNSIARLLYDQQKHEEALSYAERAIPYKKKIGDTRGLGVGFCLVGMCLYKLKKYPEAAKYCKRSLEIGKELNDGNMIFQNQQYLAKIYESAGDKDAALHHLHKTMDAKEQLINSNKNKAIHEMQTKYETEQKEKEILENKLKALKAQMNPHFIYNALNSIQSLIDPKEEKAHAHLSGFARLMRRLLENSEYNYILLEDEIRFLEDYLQLEQLRFSGNLQIQIQVDEVVEDDVMEIPTMLIQPYVENTLVHGLNGMPEATITISFDLKNDETLAVKVIDNGRGRKAVGESKKALKKRHKSLGTKVTNERLIALKNETGREFVSRTTDLVDENGDPKGTQVDLEIPVRFVD